MLLMPQHRRSTRNRATEQKVEIDDIYEDCPCFPGYEYDKDYYIASSRYSTFIDIQIAKMRAGAATKSDD
jgi:hypothetical protein